MADSPGLEVGADRERGVHRTSSRIIGTRVVGESGYRSGPSIRPTKDERVLMALQEYEFLISDRQMRGIPAGGIGAPLGVARLVKLRRAERMN